MGEIPRTSGVSKPEEPPPAVDAAPLNDVAHRDENKLRITILDQIVTCLEMKKPSWQKARILHLSTQLEESMFNSKESLEEYGDASTLPAKINYHCLLLATRKTSTSKATAPGTAGVCAFAATPASRDTPMPRITHVTIPTNGPISGSRSRLGRSSTTTTTSFILEPPSDAGADAPHSSHGETTEDDMNDDSVDDDDDDNDHSHNKLHKSSEAAAPAVPCATLSGAPNAVPLALPPPAAAAAAAAAANTLVQQEQTGEGLEHEHGHDDEDEVTEQAHVEAVIAAASLGEDAAAWNGGVQGGEPGVRQLLEGGHQRRSKQHPKATEAEVRQHALRLLECRLLLLTHASTCSKEGGSCQLAPLCDSVRQLLQHMQSCRDEKSCEFPHCKSSKAVLQHERLCTDAACRLCCSVKDLSQKCFWANARHLHKRRLEESHEQRRKKRQSEGKAVAPPRKLQAEKAKGRESCSGLDEAGNDLGDISLGFFLRQAKAVKARKKGKAQEDGGNDDTTGSAKSSGTATAAPPSHAQAGTTPSARSKRGHDGVAKGGGSAPPRKLASSPSTPPRTQAHAAQTRARAQARGEAAPAALSPSGLGSAASAFPALPSPVSSPRLRRSSSSSVSWSALLTEYPPSRGGRSPRAQDSAVAVHVPVAEDTTKAGLHGGQKAAERAGGGLTVTIPPVGSAGVAAGVGHLRSPSEIMLDDIAESFADTSRRPSFARMQSVQAFLDDHVELRESASFGDVSAMVEHWMSLEDNNDVENLEDENGMDAFSF